MAQRLAEPELKFTNGLSYWDRPGNGLPIVFLHGSGFSKEVFSKQFDSPALSDHRLLGIDLPGHGRSRNAVVPKQTYSYAGFAAALMRLFADIELGPCLVAGWSLGGQIALDMVDASPDILGICAFGAAPATPGPMGLIQSMHLSKSLLLAGKGEFTEDDARRFERVCLGRHADMRFVNALMRSDDLVRPYVSRSVLYGKNANQKERFETSATPICLIHGREDPFLKLDYMRSLSAPMLYEGGALIFDRCGHAPFIEVPSLFDAALKGFADTVAARPAGERGQRLARVG